jgi:hypothetical protein
LGFLHPVHLTVSEWRAPFRLLRIEAHIAAVCEVESLRFPADNRAQHHRRSSRMVLDSSSTCFHPEGETVYSVSGAEVTCMLSYTRTDTDTDQIEIPRTTQPDQQNDNVIIMDKSNVYFSDYIPLETSGVWVESPRIYGLAPTGTDSVLLNSESNAI